MSSFPFSRRGAGLRAISIRTAAGLLFVSSISLVGASSVITGCSDDNAGTAGDAGAEQCPTTVAAAAGAACATERMVCPISYECDNGQFLRETVECTCTDKAWACVEPGGNVVAAGAAPACTNPGGGNDKECPPTEIEGFGCHTQGLVCSYAGQTCTGSATPLTDQCQCVPNNADGGFNIHCEPGQCLTPPGDSGTVDSGDAG